MNIFNKKKSSTAGAADSVAPVAAPVPPMPAPPVAIPQPSLSDIALANIHDGVVVLDASGAIQFMNPAAATMTDYWAPGGAIGLDYALVFKLETKEGRELPDAQNPLMHAVTQNQPLEGYACTLLSGSSNKRIPISITLTPVSTGNKVITFRNITKELAEESEQSEFISTASHEMRTPVATIDGYITLALNPQTATIDDRARGYLESAGKAAKHLGKLFQDLLDATKLEDGRILPVFIPVELTSFVKQIATDHTVRANEAGLNLIYGAAESAPADDHRLEQVIYGSVDADFLREVLDNLIDNAIKYTPSGGSVYVNVVGEEDRAVISVADTGIGISAADLAHVFQKFYRADNSDTREIGGTGLGLYIVKQRVEAMGGRVWAESSIGSGTVFYVSLPRLSSAEYQKRLIAVQNTQMMNSGSPPAPTQSPVQDNFNIEGGTK